MKYNQTIIQRHQSVSPSHRNSHHSFIVAKVSITKPRPRAEQQFNAP